MEVSRPVKQHWLIWDGECGFCRECVLWVQKRDTRQRFYAVAFQTAPSPPMTTALLEQSRHTVQVVTVDGQIFSAGEACAFVLQEIGYQKLGSIMRLWGLRTIVEWGYRRVARNRDFFGRIIFGKKCAIQ
jgi:predicted DCC family thiol-disulfide oxidoreductase YuxK